MIVKVFRSATAGAAVITNQTKTVRYAVVLDETLLNKMNRRDRAFFEATELGQDNVVLLKRVPDQKW